MNIIGFFTVPKGVYFNKVGNIQDTQTVRQGSSFDPFSGCYHNGLYQCIIDQIIHRLYHGIILNFANTFLLLFIYRCQLGHSKLE